MPKRSKPNRDNTHRGHLAALCCGGYLPTNHSQTSYEVVKPLSDNSVNTSHLIINIYMVKGIYEVFTFGIRFSLISVWSRTEMKDWKLSGRNMKRFHKKRQMVLTHNINALSLSQDQNLPPALPAFYAPLWMDMRWMDKGALSKASKNVRLTFIVIAL